MPNKKFADIILKGGTKDVYKSYNEIIREKEIALLEKIDGSYRIVVGKDSDIDNVHELGKPEILEVQKNDRAGLMIPLYIYPGDVINNVTYNSIIDLARSSRDLPITAIINPGSGPGGFVDQNYIRAINRLQGANIRVIGYVRTNLTGIDKTLVAADIDQYLELYPRLDGIFFDEGTYEDNQAYFDYSVFRSRSRRS